MIRNAQELAFIPFKAGISMGHHPQNQQAQDWL